MKRKALSLLAVAALLLTMLPMAFFVVTTAEVEDPVANLDKVVMQDLGNYEPWGDNVWYNADLTGTPVCEVGKGLFFDNNVGHGVANIQIKKMADADLSVAKYLALSFGRNGLAAGSSFKLIVQFNLGSDYALANNTTVLYDNGGAELQSAVIQSGDVFSREITFVVGEADTLTAYIPVDKIVFAYNESAVPTEEALKAVQAIQLSFTDLGNKENNALSNRDAVSVREIAKMVPKPIEPVDWAPEGEKVVLQDFADMNGELTEEQATDQWGNGNKLTAANGELKLVEGPDLAAKQAGYFFLKDIRVHDWSNAEWLAMTVKVNAAPGTAANQQYRPGLAIALGANFSGGAYIIDDANPPAESRYWTKGDKAYEMAATGNDTFYYPNAAAGVAVGDVITVYVKISELGYQWGTSTKIGDITNIDGVWLGLPYDTQGNSMVSVTELALYEKYTGALSPEETTPEADDPNAAGAALTEGLDKLVVQNFKKFRRFTVSSAWPANWAAPGLDLWYNNGLTNAPAYSEEKGLYTTDESLDGNGEPVQVHGSARWILAKLNIRDFTAAQYLTVTIRKNQVEGQFKAIFSVVVAGREDRVLHDSAVVYYDNGSDTLQQAAFVGSDDPFDHQLAFETGPADTIKIYLPVSSLCSPYSGKQVTPEELLDVNCIGIAFTDLGNKGNAELANSAAVSVGEIALYNYNGEKNPSAEPAPVESAEELTDGLYRLDLQDFSGFADMKVEKELYSGDISITGTASVACDEDKGLFFQNGGKPLSLSIQALKTGDFSSAKYVAVTFGKNGVADSFRAKFTLGKKPARLGYYDMGIYYGTDARVYYDNGDGLYTAVPEKDDAITFKTGSADTVTVYIPIDCVYTRYSALGDPQEIRKIVSEDLANINSVVITFANIGNRGNADLANEDAISIRNIAAYLNTEDDIVLPSGRLLLQDFKNVNIEQLYQGGGNTNPLTPIVENGELSLRSEKGHFDLVVADLMARNVTGMEYLAVTVRFKEATSLQLGFTFGCETGVYGTGDNNQPLKTYYVDDGFRIRKVNTPNVSGGSWVGPIISRPFNSDEITLYLPLTSINNGEDGVEGIGKTFLKYVSISSGWGRSIDWIDESIENPPYLWKLEDAFAITKIEAVGSSFSTAVEDVTLPGKSTTLKDFSKVDAENLDYDLDNAEAYVEPAVRDGALWFDDLMGKFTPETYTIDMFNTDLVTKDFRGAQYLALNITGNADYGTTYAMLSLEDADLRPFDYMGEVAYVLAEDGKVYALPCDGRVGVNHALYGKNVTLLFPLEDFQLSIYYFGDDTSPLDLSNVDCVRSSLYAGSYYSPAALRSITLLGGNSSGIDGGDNNGSGEPGGDDSPVTGVAPAALPVVLLALGLAGARITRRRRYAR